jgi:hypothetical protein
VPAGGVGYLLSLVLHDWPASQALRILRNIAAASGSGARLLITELVVPSGDTPHLPKMIGLTMPTMAGGKQRTEPQWRELLTAARLHRHRRAGAKLPPLASSDSATGVTLRPVSSHAS